MIFKFFLYIIMKKKEKPVIDEEMQYILDNNNYTPLKEWKENNKKITTRD